MKQKPKHGPASAPGRPARPNATKAGAAARPSRGAKDGGGSKPGANTKVGLAGKAKASLAGKAAASGKHAQTDAPSGDSARGLVAKRNPGGTRVEVIDPFRPRRGAGRMRPLHHKMGAQQPTETPIAAEKREFPPYDGPMPTLVFEDNHLLVLNKPAGLLSQGDETGDANAVDWAKEYLKKKYAKPGEVYAALLHRLDRPVGGLLLIAKTGKAAARLSEQFKEKEVEKVYCALTEERPNENEAVLVHFLSKIEGRNIVRANTRKKTADAKESVLYYRTLKHVGQRALLEVRPISGRQHQIRTQLAKIGSTIVGDKKYGRTDFLPDKTICLFAREVAFRHPTTGQKVRFSLPLPQYGPWAEFESNLRNYQT